MEPNVASNFGAPKGGAPNPEKVGPQRVGPRRVGPRRVGGPKSRAFFFLLPAPIFVLFLSFSGGLLVEFCLCLKRRDPQMCTFGVTCVWVQLFLGVFNLLLGVFNIWACSTFLGVFNIFGRVQHFWACSTFFWACSTFLPPPPNPSSPGPPLRPGPPTISLFFSPLPPHFSFFLPSLLSSHTHPHMAKCGQIGLAKCGQIRTAKSILAKCGRDPRGQMLSCWPEGTSLACGHSESLLKHVRQTDFVQHRPRAVGESLWGSDWSLLSRATGNGGGNCSHARHHGQPNVRCLHQENSGIRHRCDDQNPLLCGH